MCVAYHVLVLYQIVRFSTIQKSTIVRFLYFFSRNFRRSAILIEMQNDSNILERIGVTLKRLRREKKLTQKVLSEMCQVNRRFISQVEHGARNVSVLTLCQIVNALGKDLATFIKEIDGNLQK